ncbi:MAG: S41 family peptidase [Bacteroidales bacterium]|nr:S41 family peptidase [Bacteroidales bacterium]
MKFLNSIIKKISITLLLFLFSEISFSQNNNFEISKNLDIFTTVIKNLDINYVDTIKPGELIDTAIESMLETLDPYTVYVPETKVEDFKFITTGEYGGIGALIHQKKDGVYISEPYKNFPADKAGLLAGDKIIKINNKSVKGKSSSDISKILKGQTGSSVDITIKRIGVKKPIKKEIIRKKIKIDNVPYFGMLNDNIGYIRLTGFTQNAGKEVKDKFLKLKKDHKLKGIIIDIRGNGGGLLNEAVKITNIFVKKGETVVSTKGKLREKNRTYKTRNQAIDTKIPLVILVDNRSASASEILSGAIQDLDRGVIIGQRTFGKGLVQNIIPLTYNTEMKITVAKYYIPSGRCIQAIDYSHKDEDGYFQKIPDSLISTFKTKNNRTVYDGGGIEPDIKLKPQKYSNITYSLYSKYLIFDYACKFHRENKTIPEPKKFIITDSIYNDFINFIKDKDYTYTSKTEKLLKSLKKTAKKENYFKDIKDEYSALSKKISLNKKDDIIRYKDEIKKILKIEICTKYYYQEGKIEAGISDDMEIEKAIEILNSPSKYNSILKNIKG